MTSLRDSGLPAAQAEKLERELVAAVESLAGMKVANAKGGKLTAPKRSSAERFAEDPVERALALGGELKAPLALAVDAAALGEGTVLYLQGVDAARGKAIGASAVSLTGGEGDAAQLSAALVRVLEPGRYKGDLAVSVDVPGAQLLVDGAPAAAGTRTLAVGTHTLRVTHPAYRDFLRFVTVEYGRPTRVDVALSKYPVDEGELRAREGKIKIVRGGSALPWYRRWWAWAGETAIVLAASAVVAGFLARDVLQADATSTCCRP